VIRVHTIEFDEDAVVVTYLEHSEVRGSFGMRRQLRFPAAGDHTADELSHQVEAVRDDALLMLRTALDVWHVKEGFTDKPSFPARLDELEAGDRDDLVHERNWQVLQAELAARRGGEVSGDSDTKASHDGLPNGDYRGHHERPAAPAEDVERGSD
jgi:hypothetical protein